MTGFTTFTRAQVHAEIDVLMYPNLDLNERVQAYLKADRLNMKLLETRSRTVLPEKNRHEIRVRVASGESKRKLADEFGVVRATVLNIVRERAK